MWRLIFLLVCLPAHAYEITTCSYDDNGSGLNSNGDECVVELEQGIGKLRCTGDEAGGTLTTEVRHQMTDDSFTWINDEVVLTDEDIPIDFTVDTYFRVALSDAGTPNLICRVHTG